MDRPNLSPIAPEKRTPPSLNGKPLLGNLAEFRIDPAEALFQAWKRAGDVYRYKVGPRWFHVICDPLLAQEVLITRKNIFQRPRMYKGATALGYLLGLSVLTVDGELWLPKRRMMQPIFHKNRIQAMVGQMVSAGEAMLTRWSALPSAQEVNLSEEMKLVTLDIINRTMFSTDILPEVDRIGRTVDIGLHYIQNRVTNPVSFPETWPTPANRRFQHEKAILDEFLYATIRERRAGSQHPGDLLDMLLEARDEETGEGMNDEQVRNEVATIYGAGHETTAVALTWAWVALNQHPMVLRKLLQEVDGVLQGRSPVLEDLPNLPFTSAVFEETLRVYPPVPLTVRVAEEDTVVGNFVFPRGSMAMISIYNVHRHPDYWADPLTFQPERFLPENKSALNRAAYIPFLTGPHLCIGNNFALMEGQLLLAMMAQRYIPRLDAARPIERDIAITMRPRGGLPVRLERRAV
jgi:cytochrome P450